METEIIALPIIFPSVEWFDAARREFNADETVRSGGGGACDAKVGVKIGERAVYLLVFEGFECVSASEIGEANLADADFYMDMAADDWREMIENIAENGEADFDHTLNTLDLDIEDGLAKSAAGDQYLQDLFYRYNQTFQYFFDRTSRMETVFAE